MSVLLKLSRSLCSLVPKGSSTFLLSSSTRLCHSSTTDFRTPLHYNPEIRPGTEKWHNRVPVAGSAGKTFNWPNYNERVYKPDGTYRPAFVCHMRSMVKYSPDKMFYVASFVRGLTVEEAIKQLSFVQLKGAVIVKEVLEEARELALKEHNFEFSTNMWVAESFTNQMAIIKGLRRHARMRMGTIRHKYIGYYVRLEEGQPPQHYYDHLQTHWKANDWLQHYLKEHRQKSVPFH